MKKFTKLLYVMTLLLLMSSVAFAQVVITPKAKQDQTKASTATENVQQFRKADMQKTDQQIMDEEKKALQQIDLFNLSSAGPVAKDKGIQEKSPVSYSPLYFSEKPASSFIYDPKYYPVPDQGGNDFATALPIASLPFSATGTTLGYTNNYDAVCPYTGSTAPDVVYSYTPAANGVINISLCNDPTNYDSKLYVMDAAQNVIACNDDFCSTISYPNAYVSQVGSVNVTGGITYYIVVDGYGSSAGNYEIYVENATVYPVPPNDECTGATVVTGSFPQTVYGTTLGATVDCPGLLDWNAVWYKIDLPYAVNNLTVDWCGTANMSTVGVVYYTSCPVVCENYMLYTSNVWSVCGTPPGATTAKTAFNGIVGPTTIWYPAYSIPQMDHVLTFDVQDAGAPCAVTCPPGATLENEPDILDNQLDVTNGGCNMAPATPLFKNLNTAGQTYCGKANTYLFDGADYRDTDWYRLDLSEEAGCFNLTWRATAEFPVIVFLVDAGTENCTDYVILQSATANPCDLATVTATGLQPKVYWAIVAPSVFTGYPASTGPHDYVAEMIVTPVSCPTAGPCQYTSQWGSAAIDGGGALTTISTCSYAGEYSIASNIQAGKNYQFTMSNLGTGAYITITDGPGPSSNVFAYGPSPLNYLATSGANLYLHWSLNSNCDTDASCHVTTGQCLDCVATGPGCGNTYLGLITPGAAWQTASYLAGDTYYWSFNATAGTTYAFENCLAGEDTYIRIYDAAYVLVASNDDNGPYCTGTPASIDWLSPASGTYYISLAHYSCALLDFSGDLNYRTVPACVVTCPPGSIPEGEPCGDDLNGGCNMAIPAFTPVTFGATVCGNYWATGGTRDTDWYEVITTNPLTKITMNFEGEIPSVFGFMEQIVPGTPGCGNITGYINPAQLVPACTPSFVEVFVGPGTYYFFVGPQTFEGYPCPGFTYVVGWTAENISVYEVSGTLTYAGPGAIPIDNSLVEVYDGLGNLLGTVPTDDFGYYSFFALGGLDYELYASTCKPRGGTNVADVNLVVAHLLGNPLTGVRFLAADVNDDGLISVGDYNLLVSELLGANPVWAAPDWVFESPSFTLNSDLTVNFQGLASGDPDGSFAVPFGNFCPCEFVITISSTGYLDETSFTFTDNLSNVVLLGGPFDFGSTNVFYHTDTNPPYTFYLETMGSFNDNIANYTIENSFGDILFQGTVLGGTDVTITNITCNP